MNNYTLTSQNINLLKIIAIISMIIDHFFKILYPEVIFYNFIPYAIGRIAYPFFTIILIYNFLFNTKNQTKYILRIFIFAIISQPFFMYAFDTLYLNIFFSLFFVLLGIKLIEKYENENKLIDKGIILFLGLILLIISYFSDYSIYGFIFSIFLYLFIKSKEYVFLFLAFIFLYIANNSNIFIYFLENKVNIEFLIDYLTKSLFALLLVYLVYSVLNYNKNVIKINFPKYFFYLFYPLHLLIFKLLTLI